MLPRLTLSLFIFARQCCNLTDSVKLLFKGYHLPQQLPSKMVQFTGMVDGKGSINGQGITM